MILSHTLKIITPPENLTGRTKDSFFQAVCQLAMTDVEVILVNLESVNSIDSNGLGVLYGAHRLAAQQGRKLVLYCPQQQLNQRIQQTGLDQVITIYSTLRSCLQNLMPITPRSVPLMLPNENV